MIAQLWQFVSYAYTGPFVNGFLVLFTPAVVLVVLTLILFNRLGRGMGLAKLFRNDKGAGPEQGSHTPGRVFIGMGVATVFWQGLYAGYVFEPFATNYSDDRSPWAERYAGLYGGAIEEPAGIGEFALYALTITVCLAGTLAVLWGLLNAFDRFGKWMSLPKRGEAVPTPPPAPHLPIDDWRVSSPPFWGGFVLGVVVLASLTSVFFNETEAKKVAEDIGVRAMNFAGYGKARARAAWKKLGETEKAEREYDDFQRKKRAKEVQEYAAYHAVFGVFFLHVALALGVYVLLFVQWFVWRPGLFSPAAGIVFVMQTVIFQSIILYMFLPAPGAFRLMVAIFLIYLGGLRLYKRKFPNLDYRKPASLALYAERVRAAGDNGRPAGPDEPVLRDDATTPVLPRPAGFPKAPLVVVCVSGGGSRAATWTTAVMGRLEHAFGRAGIALPHHARFVAGASGGMIGMANYVAGLEAPDDPTKAKHVKDWPKLPDGPALTADDLEAWLRTTGVTHDWLGTISHRLLYFDIPSLFLPFGLRRDRGRALEHEWVRDLRGLARADYPRDGATFRGLLAGERAGWRPSLVFTPMLVEDGRQLVVSNLDLVRTLRNMGNEAGQPDRVMSRPGVEFFDLFADQLGNEKDDTFRVATAARMSATFPYVLPAVPLPTVPPRRVVDAGYIDNYGVQVAGAWLDAYTDWVKDKYSGVLFVQIRDGLSREARRMEKVFPPETESLAWRSLHWLTSPFAGLLSARMAGNTFRNDNLLDLLDDRYNAGPDAGFFTSVVFEFDRDDDVSLNFRLTAEELRAIAESACTLPEIDPLVAWWQSRPTT